MFKLQQPLKLNRRLAFTILAPPWGLAGLCLQVVVVPQHEDVHGRLRIVQALRSEVIIERVGSPWEGENFAV